MKIAVKYNDFLLAVFDSLLFKPIVADGFYCRFNGLYATVFGQNLVTVRTESRGKLKGQMPHIRKEKCLKGQ